MKKFRIIILFGISVFFIVSSCSKTDNTVLPPSENGGPTTPYSPIPSNGATGVSGFVTLTWSCSDPNTEDTVRYNVVYGPTSNPTTVLASNILNRAADLGVVPDSTTVYWKVSAKDNHGNTTVGPVWKFTTAH